MTKDELVQAFEVAKSDRDLSSIEMDNLIGYGLPDFGKTYTTIDAVARLMRWQARYLNGEFNMDELDRLMKIAAKKFIIVG